MANAQTSPASKRITIEVHGWTAAPGAELGELRAGLLREPPEISSKYFYDDRGSQLFEQICELPEYYQTRTEADLLASIADEVVRVTGADELVELGSGAATKTRLLLDAMQRAQRLSLYVPFDVNEAIVRREARQLTERYDRLQVHGVVGEFTNHLTRIPDGGRRLLIFLGGTIGNFRPGAAADFLSAVARVMEGQDTLLLGIDLVKDPDRLEAAYNDTRGVTAEFNRNILRVVNGRAAADFDADGFAHRAFYDRDAHRIEMRLRSLRDQVVRLEALRMTIGFPAGREILTEISVKYSRELVVALLEGSGFEMIRWYIDPDRLFALTLARRR